MWVKQCLSTKFKLFLCYFFKNLISIPGVFFFFDNDSRCFLLSASHAYSSNFL